MLRLMARGFLYLSELCSDLDEWLTSGDSWRSIRANHPDIYCRGEKWIPPDTSRAPFHMPPPDIEIPRG